MKKNTLHLLLTACIAFSFVASAENTAKKPAEKAAKSEKTVKSEQSQKTEQTKEAQNKALAPVTLLFASSPNQGSPDGENASPFAKTLTETLKDTKKTTQQNFLSDVRKRYQDMLTEQKITNTQSYLVNPWINSYLPLCGEDTTYVITIGANDYGVGRLKNAVSDANNVQDAFSDYCPNARMFAVRELAFSSQIIYNFLDELKKNNEKDKKNKSLIIYYSGLGASQEHNRYLLSPRTPIVSIEDLKITKQSILVNQLEEKIADLGSTWRATVLLDTGFPPYK